MKPLTMFVQGCWDVDIEVEQRAMKTPGIVRVVP